MRIRNIVKITTYLLVILSLIGNSFAQTIKLKNKKKFEVDKSLIEQLNSNNPGSSYADSFALAEMSEITYMSDGYKIKGFLIEPVKKGKYPCLIYNREGQENTNTLNQIFVAEHLHQFARQGYVVIASQYRGGGNSEGKDEYGGSDIDDVINLIPLLANISKADTSRIGMYGWNRGGMMTYLALKHTDKIDAAIVSSAITNVFLFAAENLEAYDIFEKLIPEYPEQRVTPLKDRSMLYWYEELPKTTPILILHGSADIYVNPTNSIHALEKLMKAKIPVRYVMFEGADNKLTENRAEADKMIIDWLNKYVRDQHAIPNVNPH